MSSSGQSYFVASVLLLRFSYKCSLRVVLNLVSKIIWICLTSICNRFIEFAPFSSPAGAKTKTNRYIALRKFPALGVSLFSSVFF